MLIHKFVVFAGCLSILQFFYCKNQDNVKVFEPDVNFVDNICTDVKCYSINGGDTICYKGGVISTNTRLPDDHPCTQHLIEVKPSSKPGTSRPPDTLPESQMISVIIPDSSKFYGFDDGREYYPYDQSSFEKRTSYLSVKEGGAARFQLNISSSIFRNFSFFKAKISNTSTIAFDSIYTLDTIVIRDTLIDISIYGRWENEYFPVEITIYGFNRSGDSIPLVCDTCEQELQVFCWEEMIFDSLRIYFVNNPSFNPDSITIKNENNSIIKQAVQKIAFVFKGVYNKRGWDNNGNGELDFFPKIDSVPPERLEHSVLLDSIQATFTDCYSCNDPQISKQTPKIIVTPSAINTNWLLMEDAHAYSDTIIVQYDNDFDNKLRDDNFNFILSSWDGRNVETFKINNIINDTAITNENKNRMGLKIYAKDLLYDHPRHSVLIQGNNPRGVTFTTTSCTWMMGATNYHDIIHELLHMRKVGPLSHDTKDTLNLMFKSYVNSSYNLVRCRQIITDGIMGNGTYEKQWEIIRKNKL